MQRIVSWKVAFAAAAVGWALAIPSAAWLVAGRPVHQGRWAIGAAVYMAGAVVCHQKPERSFVLAGRPLPVCARCTGIYSGAALVAVWLLSGSASRHRSSDARRQTRAARTAALLAAAPTLATLGYEWTTGDTPSNLLRAAAGLPLGAVVPWIVMRSTNRATAQKL